MSTRPRWVPPLSPPRASCRGGFSHRGSRVTRCVTLGLLLVGLGLGTFGMELTTGLALVVAVLVGERRRLGVFAGPLLVLATAYLLAAPLGGPGAWREVLGRVWPLAPLLAVPALTGDQDERLERLGLAAACIPAVWGVVERLLGEPGAGPFSHHLTLGYALCVPLAFAARRGRWLVAAILVAGVASTGGTGPLLSVAVVLAAVYLVPPTLALAGGVALTLAALVLGQQLGRADVHERAVLWTSGAWLAVDRAVGTGTGHARDAASVVQGIVEPGFHFPLHAHDSALQLASVVGMGGWIALVWLSLELWRRADRAGRAVLAALVVGSLTQDLLGDLEVARTAAVWLGWSTLAAGPATSAGSGEPNPQEAVP